ncbi:MAG: hypothetical protein ACREID_01290, partial [Planctomycetota bacterium]
MSLLAALNRRFLLRYRLEYAVALLVIYGVRSMSPEFAWGGARVLGKVLFLLGVRRKTALHNLALAFPEMPSGARKALARRTLQHFCQMAVDILLQRRMLGRHNFYRRFTITGWA